MNKGIIYKVVNYVKAGQDRDALELLLRVIPENFRDEAILHSARFHDIQKQFRLGLIDSEKQRVTMSQIRYGIMETIKAIEGQNSISVLVAGTGKFDLPKEVYWLTSAIGKELGRKRHKLICGGWEGVDYVVAEEFSKVILDSFNSIFDYLVQIVPENSMPVFKGIPDTIVSAESEIYYKQGNVIFVKPGVREWLEAIKYSDVVILIGGEGGTYETFVYAHQENRPVIPIFSSGGDSEKAYNQIIHRWDYWHTTMLKPIPVNEFKKLSEPIKNEYQAEEMARVIISMIERLTTFASPPTAR